MTNPYKTVVTIEMWNAVVRDLVKTDFEVERLKAKIAYVRHRSQRACEILNEFEATEPKP